jgi:hypothetical protein
MNDRLRFLALGSVQQYRARGVGSGRPCQLSTVVTPPGVTPCHNMHGHRTVHVAISATPLQADLRACVSRKHLTVQWLFSRFTSRAMAAAFARETPSPTRSTHRGRMRRRKKKQKTNRGPRLTPEGLRPQHPRRGGRRVGNAGQHGKREATRESASNCAPDQQQTHVHQQALPHQQQTTQPGGHKRQEASKQQQKQGEDKRTRSRKDPGATACKSGEQPQGQKSQHAEPGARARQQKRHQTKDPKDQATNQ